MSFIPHPTLEEMMSPGFEHRYIVAMAEASKEYESEQLQKAILRREKFNDALVGAVTPNDKAAYIEQIERLDKFIETEQTRLGL